MDERRMHVGLPLNEHQDGRRMGKGNGTSYQVRIEMPFFPEEIPVPKRKS